MTNKELITKLVPPLIEQNDDSTLFGSRLRVLLSAHEFSPIQGSECAVGWNIAIRLAQYCDITVLCASGSHASPHSYKTAYEAYVRASGAPIGMNVIFVDQPFFGRVLIAINKFASGFSDGPGIKVLFLGALKAWNRAAARRAMTLGLDNFDIVHHLNPIAYWSVNKYWRKAKVFCWGPVGGIYTIPFRFTRWLGWKSTVVELAKSIMLVLDARAIARTLRGTTLVWTISSAEEKTFHRLASKQCMPMIETGTSVSIKHFIRRYDVIRPLVICWSGRHVAHKALPILIEAIASSKIRDRIRLIILGAGPMTDTWKCMAADMGLDANFQWLGNLTHENALLQMQKADILAHTSLREGTPHAVTEALSMGMPVICHDACGMGIAVNEHCGIKLPLESPSRSIDGFRTALEQFLAFPELLEKLSIGALRRASELTWDAKAAEIASAYREYISAAQVGRNSGGKWPVL